ncbi:hypothetical protein DSM100238_1550 [Bifidobacterium apri]|uniref:Uncharacterized protein n=1 Tax=Bifidobacterium apri TaxID=1769423 RepID=A0A6A2W2M8_9BIFI|nr:hypothetical protein DSM100238_1550 [Bifidobacterium apri]
MNLFHAYMRVLQTKRRSSTARLYRHVIALVKKAIRMPLSKAMTMESPLTRPAEQLP